MPKRRVQPIRAWHTQAEPTQENCPNRAVLDPSVLPHGMTYRPLRRKTSAPVQADATKEEPHETADDLSVPPQAHAGDGDECPAAS